MLWAFLCRSNLERQTSQMLHSYKQSWFSGRGWGQQLFSFRVRRFTESPGPLRWTAFPVEILTKLLVHWIASPLFIEKPFFSLQSASSHPLPKNWLWHQAKTSCAEGCVQWQRGRRLQMLRREGDVEPIKHRDAWQRYGEGSWGRTDRHTNVHTIAHVHMNWEH